MPSSTSSSEFIRTVPDAPWRRLAASVAILTASAVVGWEAYVRSTGYAPTIDDTPDLWAEARASVRPDSVVLIGTSRMLFDMDLDLLEHGLGRRPVQLSIVGSSPYPILADLAADKSFHGTVLCDIVPAMFLAPPGSPPYQAAEKALHRHRSWNLAQRWSHALSLPLERRVAFLQQEDLTLARLLEKLPVPNRAGAFVNPQLPPYFYTLDRDRRARMTAETALVGSPLNQSVVEKWLPLFSPPPPPSFIPIEQFQAMMAGALEARFRDTAQHVARIRERGGRVVFLRLPVTGPLAEREQQLAPEAHTWGRLVRENEVPAIHFAEHDTLNTFDCPEWSHLSAEDSVEFTRRLVPHLQDVLQLASTGAPAIASTAKPKVAVN